MDAGTDPELVESMLNTAAYMQVLEDSLDRLSLHSITGSRSNSRESLQSSSKYDSAFDSHFSEDTLSINSSVVTSLHPVEASMLPLILTPPLPYRVTTPSEEEEGEDLEGRGGQGSGKHSTYHHKGSYAKNKVKDRNLREHVLKKRHNSPASSPNGRTPPISGSEPVMSNLASPKQPELVYLELTPPTRSIATPTNTENTPTEESNNSPTRAEITPPTPPLRRLSDSSSTDDLVSNDSTPTMPRHIQDTKNDSMLQHQPLDPSVTIIYPQNHQDSDSDTDTRQYSPRHSGSRRPPQFPKHGTVFYQDSLTPQPSPLHTAHRHSTSPTHLLPSRYSHSIPEARREPKRTTSILQRLKRKQGSFKEDSQLKRRLPVKRSLSERVTYHIKKGWVDYVEDLDFISQPSYPRAVGRMIDKRAGQLHVVQLYKPPNGRYGIYISQRGDKSGIFISRFADATAAKFYTGLISPGDQIVRVNGKNIVDQSVDYVYDLMTLSDSVIFTVIPVSSHSNWW